MADSWCERCGNLLPHWDKIRCRSADGSYYLICSPCWNAEIAESFGRTAFENVRLDSVRMIDCDGESHKFQIRVSLLDDKVLIDAFELREGYPAGYQFQLIGDSDDHVLILLGRLVEKIRRALSVRHIDFRKRCIVGSTVRGLIEWDEDGHLPRVIVDGQELSWDDFGRIVLPLNGWLFRLDFADPSDEL